jgi:hypothetical protein
MGCCVGQRNYAQFWWLVIFQIVTASFTLTTCILHMVNNAKNKEEDQSKAAAIFNYSGVFALIGTLYSAVVSLEMVYLIQCRSSSCLVL